jgi:acylphosphatase
VQGVFFRAGTADEAKKLGLRGWVRNNPDGSVEIVAEGARTQLEKLLEWCIHGPEGAKVSGIEYDWGTASAGIDSSGFVDFRVRRD